MLIHGFWVTPRSWEEWISYYQDKGYRVLDVSELLRVGSVANRR